MKADLEIFGTARSPLASETPQIYIVHGFMSSSANMVQLEALIQQLLPKATIIRFNYDWKQSILRSGAELANTVFVSGDERKSVLFVGHSMGGLVSRVANVILSTPVEFAGLI